MGTFRVVHELVQNPHLDTFKDIWGQPSGYDSNPASGNLDTFKDIWGHKLVHLPSTGIFPFRYLQGYMGTRYST